MAKVIVENLHKIYPAPKNGAGKIAVNNASFTIEDGEFMVLVGPSGCGKTTTLRMIAGLEDISKGSIYIADKKVNDVPPKDRDIGMVFQNYALYPHMTVHANMAFGLKLRGVAKAEIERRVMDAARILGFLEPDNLLDRKPKALSGGQRQRVALGRAIVRNPKVFLFDEPLSNLDAKMRVEMRREITRLHQRLGNTMIYVTHDQVEAMTMATRIVVMKDGVVQQIADPLTLFNQPANLFVAGFIGSPAINLIRGQIKRQSDHRTLAFTARDTTCFTLDQRQADALQAWVDRDIIWAIRPEYLNTGATPSTGFPVTLELAELMGAETYLHCHLGPHPLILRTPHTDIHPHPGDTFHLTPTPAHSLFFDPATETRIVF
ncbi:MAG: sn-glycerol-3-phosphate ABC transporter ATP-binding protein UgpC [Verrucomicrobiales bacterium]|jgi:multiple sugar transport system ATP-binding protein|nr:sn-glycerol-3-phosphate ABC transporter ATP-binding protein UgpC [Verrucomicrobiales bacterium]